MYEKESNVLSVISAFVIGGFIGASIALLMAPQSGEETRSLLRNKSAELKDKAIETASETRDRASHTLSEVKEQAKDKVSNLTSRGQEIAEDTQQRLRAELRRS